MLQKIFDILKEFWHFFLITVVMEVVMVEVADVNVAVEVVIADIMAEVMEVIVADMVVEVAHLLLITDPDPDVITDHALGLIVLVSTYYDPHWALFSYFFLWRKLWWFL